MLSGSISPQFSSTIRFLLGCEAGDILRPIGNALKCRRTMRPRGLNRDVAVEGDAPAGLHHLHQRLAITHPVAADRFDLRGLLQDVSYRFRAAGDAAGAEVRSGFRRRRASCRLRLFDMRQGGAGARRCQSAGGVAVHDQHGRQAAAAQAGDFVQ
jgi:hypothetical protein